MNPDVFDSLLGHPLGQLVVTVIVAVVTSVVTVRLMTARPVPAPAAVVNTTPASAPGAGEDPALIAAITAAVYATIGAHRIVYIGESPSTGSSWTTEMRSRHHASHAVAHTRPSGD